MKEIKVEVPEELEKEMERFNVDWSKLAKDFFRFKVFEFELEQSKELQRAMFEVLASKSKLTEKDALELGRKVNESMFKDLKDRGFV